MKITKSVLQDMFIDYEVGEKTDDGLLTLLFATEWKTEHKFLTKTIYVKSADDTLYSYSSYAQKTKDDGFYYEGLELEKDEIELKEVDIEDYYCDRLVADIPNLKKIIGVLLVDDDTSELLDKYKFWNED